MDLKEVLVRILHRIFVITNLKQEHMLVISDVSGPNRRVSCFSFDINGAGAICCQDDFSCKQGPFGLGSGDELQMSVCCSGRRSCRRAEFTGSPLRFMDACLAGKLQHL